MDISKKLPIANRAALVSMPQAFVSKLSKILLLTSIGTVLAASPGWAVALKPTQLSVSVPAGSNNPQADGSTLTYNIQGSGSTAKLVGTTTAATQTFVDDVLLSTITFGGVTLNSGNMRQASKARVVSGRTYINAEYGDQDTGSDGNPNPFVSAGDIAEGATLPPAIRESTDPSIQDKAIREAFNSLSLSQGVDGEGTNYTYNLIFDSGIIDSSTAVDSTPELIFFERGANSSFSVKAIIGGTFETPVFATKTVNIAIADLLPSGVYIDTIEISTKQELGVVGVDLNDFGLSANQVVYGVQLTSTVGSGADIYGQFLTAANPSQFRRQAVPEPLTIIGSGMALGFGFLLQRQYAKKLKKV